MCDHIDFLHEPIDDAFRVLGKRWATTILMEVLSGTDHFNLLKQAVPRISPRTLSSRLDELEKVGLIARKVTHQSPSRVMYTLTAKGEDIRPLLRVITGFSLKWYARQDA